MWHGIRLKRSLTLAAKERFKFVVVLREPETNPDGDLTKGVDGPTGKRRIKDERTVRRATWPLVTAGLGVLLAGVLFAVNVVPDPVSAAEPGIECVTGDLDIVGSSAFSPIMTDIAAEHSTVCAGAEVTVTGTGSILRCDPAVQAPMRAIEASPT